jgi:hypothetical protein
MSTHAVPFHAHPCPVSAVTQKSFKAFPVEGRAEEVATVPFKLRGVPGGVVYTPLPFNQVLGLALSCGASPGDEVVTTGTKSLDI